MSDAKYLPPGVNETPVQVLDRDYRDPIQPWERTPRETDAQWALFLAFKDQAYPDGPGGSFVPRNVAALAREVGLTRKTVQGYATAYQWHGRAGAWDRELERRKDQASLTVAEANHQRHLRRLKKLGTLAEQELDKLLTRAEDAELHVLTPKDVLAMLDFAQKGERLLAGDPTDHLSLSDGGLGQVNLENLELEDLEALQRILRKAEGKNRPG